MVKLEELPTLVRIIAVVALIAGMFAIILDQFQIQQETTTVVVNDSITFAALDTFYDLEGNDSITYYVRLVNSSMTMRNDSIYPDGDIARAGNWSVNIATGQIRALSGGNVTAGDNWNVSHSYVYGSEARNIYGEGLTGVLEITSWLDLVALAVMAGILLYIIMASIGGRTGKGTGPAY